MMVGFRSSTHGPTRSIGTHSRSRALTRCAPAFLERFWLFVPSMEGRQVAGVPSLTNSRSLEIPVGANLTRHGPQVVPEIQYRRPPPEPIPVIDAVDDE